MGGKFYVYEHWRQDKNVPFYVGLGCGRRCNVMYGRDEQHHRIQRKLEKLGLAVDVRVITAGLTRAEAITREIERIAYWRSLNVKLVNRTAGGDGTLSPCEETRELMRQRKLGKKLSSEHKAKIAAASRRLAAMPEYIAKLSAAIKVAANTPESRERRSKAIRARVRTPEHNAKIAAAHRGRKLSPEHAAKARLASLGRKQPQEEIERRRASLKAAWARKNFASVTSGTVH